MYPCECSCTCMCMCVYTQAFACVHVNVYLCSDTHWKSMDTKLLCYDTLKKYVTSATVKQALLDCASFCTHLVAEAVTVRPEEVLLFSVPVWSTA